MRLPRPCGRNGRKSFPPIIMNMDGIDVAYRTGGSVISIGNDKRTGVSSL